MNACLLSGPHGAALRMPRNVVNLIFFNLRYLKIMVLRGNMTIDSRYSRNLALEAAIQY